MSDPVQDLKYTEYLQLLHQVQEASILELEVRVTQITLLAQKNKMERQLRTDLEDLCVAKKEEMDFSISEGHNDAAALCLRWLCKMRDLTGIDF